MMSYSFSRQKTPATSKCRRHQQDSNIYNGSSERDSGTAHLPILQQYPYQVQNQSMQGPEGLPLRQNLQIELPNAVESLLNDKFDQRSCLSFNHDCSTGSIRDDEAARQVDRFMQRRKPQLTARILRNLVIRRDELDDNSLHDLLLAANKTIFGGRLSGRVRWEWSQGQPEYDHDLLGTTALISGYKTVIVLSRPLLQNERFSRDLLLSTFLHELIHSYLFIQCGLEHAKDDGHTAGFHKIAKLIDKRFGHQRLHLCNMRANLDHFLVSKMPYLPPLSDPIVTRKSWPRSLSRKPKRHSNNSTDEGYYSRDRSPHAEVLCSSTVDDGYGTRDPSPGSPGSPGSPLNYVWVETVSESSQTECQLRTQ